MLKVHNAAFHVETLPFIFVLYNTQFLENDIDQFMAFCHGRGHDHMDLLKPYTCIILSR